MSYYINGASNFGDKTLPKDNRPNEIVAGRYGSVSIVFDKTMSTQHRTLRPNTQPVDRRRLVTVLSLMVNFVLLTGLVLLLFERSSISQPRVRLIFVTLI